MNAANSCNEQGIYSTEVAKNPASTRPVSATRSRTELVDRSLYRIAAILLRIGLDAPAAERMLRKAFILAARDHVERTSPRATQSHIASLAGVSRREVRIAKPRQPSRGNSASQHASPTRLQEIVTAWRTDPRFADRRGRPRPLSLTPGRNSFDDLSKSYGRDVTTKTLKDQLIQKRLVEEQQGKLVLLAISAVPRREAGDSDLQFLASQLQAINFHLGRRAYVTKRVSISADDRKSAQRIRRLVTERLEPLLNSIASLSANPTGKPNRRQGDRFRILVSTAIATEEGVHDDQKKFK